MSEHPSNDQFIALDENSFVTSKELAKTAPISFSKEDFGERIFSQWKFGDWERLSKIDLLALEESPGRARLALFCAAGHLQFNRFNQAQEFIHAAEGWGATPNFVCQILIAGTYNTLGRIAALDQRKPQSLEHFENALDVDGVVEDRTLLAMGRADLQCGQLGLPPLSFGGKLEGQPPDISTSSEAIENEDFSSVEYWEQRYREGRTSGNGSYGQLADFKANVINELISTEKIRTVLELGCGDGNQLAKINAERYCGVDVSATVIDKCREVFKNDSTKSFCTLTDFDRDPRSADLTLSLDVLYHLVEDRIFEDYLHKLFDSANTHCIIYSCNEEPLETDPPHVRRRIFTRWVEENKTDWRLVSIRFNDFPFARLKNGKNSSMSDFYFYKRANTVGHKNGDKNT